MATKSYQVYVDKELKDAFAKKFKGQQTKMTEDWMKEQLGWINQDKLKARINELTQIKTEADIEIKEINKTIKNLEKERGDKLIEIWPKFKAIRSEHLRRLIWTTRQDSWEGRQDIVIDLNDLGVEMTYDDLYNIWNEMEGTLNG